MIERILILSLSTNPQLAAETLRLVSWDYSLPGRMQQCSHIFDSFLRGKPLRRARAAETQ